ncbi:protein TFG-like [Halichondria panicea]|uniref:protein TFG-like n=1 Tax=Halichondria panicea TaxID=6063 RepID=UPI00312B3260
MVHIKVSNGVETRRFQVTGELSFEQLQEKLASIFPSAVVDQLQYRDSDGDVITISSDGELQEALSSLPNDSVLKLHIQRRPTPRPRQSLFSDIFEPSTSIWDQLFGKQYKATESLLEQLWGRAEESSDTVCPEGSECPHTACPEDREAEAKVNETKSSDEEEVKSKVDQTKSSDGDEVKSKSDDETTVKSKDTPVIRSHTVLSWEPQLQYTWLGPRTVLRPVRYNVHYWGLPSEEAGNDKTKTSNQATPQETPVH